MVYRSFFFGPSSDEFFLSAGADGGEVDTVIGSLVLPNLGQLIEDLLVFDGQLEGLIDGAVVHNSGDEVVGRDVGNGVLLFGDVGDLHGGGGRCGILILLVGEDVDSDDGGLG